MPLYAATLATTNWASATGNTASYPTSSTRNNVSNLVPGLTNGTNAMAIGTGHGEIDESDNARYEVQPSTAASKAVILSRVSTMSNWKRYDGTAGAEFPDLATNTTAGWTNFLGGNYTVNGSDNIKPVCQSITLVGTPAANSASVSYTVTFDETVSNVSTDDFTVATVSGTAAGTVSGVSGSGASYTVTVSSITGTGTLRLNLNGNSNIVDSFGNGNGTNGFVNAVNGTIHSADRDNPTVSIASPQSSPTNAASITINITFNESVTGFDINDVGVSNGSKSNFTGSGASYSLLVTPTADGTVTVSVGANVAIDAANNNNNAASNFTITSDRTQPTVSITSAVANPTNSSSFAVTITFSESVTGFVVGDITASNASLSGFSGSGSSYTVNVNPTVDGNVTLNINSNVAADGANNGNSAATQFSRTSDRTSPTVSITSSASSVTNTNPIPVTVTFSEAVSNFVAGDVVIGNGTISGFSGGNGVAVYTFNVVPSGNGTVTVNVASGVANDAAGNNNTAATQLSRTFDNTQPTVSMTSAAGNPTNTAAIPVTVTFSESVTGFDSSDISPGNGSISGFSGSGASYSFTLTASSNGTVTANIVGGIAFDAAGNGNTAAAQFSRTYDNVRPAFTTPPPPPGVTNLNPSTVNISLTESVTGFDASDISVVNGSVVSLSGSGSSYTVTVSAAANGNVTVNVGANAYSDAAGNTNTATFSYTYLYDNTSPSVSITSSTSATTNSNPIPVTITFSEAVSNFIQSDITVTNGSITGFSGGSNVAIYTFNLVPAGTGTVTVDVAAGVAADIASNTNTAATQLSRVYDSSQPTLSITSSASSPTNASTIPLTFTFSESVTGFDVTDITTFGGSLSGFSGSGSVYTATVTPSGDGSITLFVFQNSAVDVAGNGNTFASFNIVSDRTRPTVTISSPQTSPTSTNPFTINITFSESVTGFDVSDITTTGSGSLSGFSGSGANYSVNFTASGNGNKTFNIAQNKAIDAAGNNNFAAAQFSMAYVAQCSQNTVWNGLFWTNGDPIATQPAIISGDYVSSDVNPGGFSACSLIIGNGANVFISSGDVLNISGNVTVQAGSPTTFANGSTLNLGGNLISQANASVTFEDNANLMQTATSNNNSGNITVKRSALMRRLDYVYWSTPVAGQNLKLFSPYTVSPVNAPGFPTPTGSSRFYTFNESGNAFAVIANPENTTMAAAQGYMVSSRIISLPTQRSKFSTVPSRELRITGIIPCRLPTTQDKDIT
ncbi:beta strand repeat-containing protein [Flavobacterium sp. 3HN19-14]|uniref:beta strand repeat-containing protein n=1 Tax=Flavobacterium sp. 3HN19-14 TaxID=3448133 RepID=UPI003EE23D39